MHAIQHDAMQNRLSRNVKRSLICDAGILDPFADAIQSLIALDYAELFGVPFPIGQGRSVWALVGCSHPCRRLDSTEADCHVASGLLIVGGVKLCLASVPIAWDARTAVRTRRCCE